MKRISPSSALLTALALALTVTLWTYLAPTKIGGSTTYVVTHGISMEPRFHSGDLAIVRPAASYRVGDIVAYRSSMLNLVVLHRIYAIRDGRYTFKGDNNHFLDPVHPTRAALVGKLWIHIPHGGAVLIWLHRPLTAALLAGLAGMLLLFFPGRKLARRGRRARRRRGPAKGTPMPAERPGSSSRIGAADARILAAIAGTLAVALLGLTVIAFTRPTQRMAARSYPYTQQVSFGYRASAPAGAVYPDGAVTTGDPIFLQLVHRLGVQIGYRLTTSGAQAPSLRGTIRVLLKLTGPTGWTRTIPLTRPRRFTGAATRTTVDLDLSWLQAMVADIARQTGIAASGYTAAVVAQVDAHGLISGQPASVRFAPKLPFQLNPLQLQVGSAALAGSAGSSAADVLAPTTRGAVATAASAANAIGLPGVSLGVTAARFLAPVGAVIALTAALLLGLLALRGQALGESARIRVRYGHLIVPINAGTDLGWPAIDVPSIKALARLAEASGQLILHSPGAHADTYLVNDEGSVYRYTVSLPRVVWGEWTEPTGELAPALT